MTDKTIINGVDVSGCEFSCIDEFPNTKQQYFTCSCHHDINCESFPNCYYKQCARKDERIRELEAELEKFKKTNEEKNNFLQKLGISSTGEFRRLKYYMDKDKQKLSQIAELTNKVITMDDDNSIDYSYQGIKAAEIVRQIKQIAED